MCHCCRRRDRPSHLGKCTRHPSHPLSLQAFHTCSRGLADTKLLASIGRTSPHEMPKYPPRGGICLAFRRNKLKSRTDSLDRQLHRHAHPGKYTSHPRHLADFPCASSLHSSQSSSPPASSVPGIGRSHGAFHAMCRACGRASQSRPTLPCESRRYGLSTSARRVIQWLQNLVGDGG